MPSLKVFQCSFSKCGILEYLPESGLAFHVHYGIYPKYWDTLSTYHTCPKT